MATNDIYLGPTGSEILLTAFGRTFSEGLTEVKREARTASGRLVKDIIATKRTFTLAYTMIHHDDLEDIATLYAMETELSLIVTRPSGTPDTYTVFLRPFDKKRVKSINMQYWGGVNIELEEV